MTCVQKQPQRCNFCTVTAVNQLRLVSRQTSRHSAYFYHILFGFLDGILDVEVGLGISDGITDTNGMTWQETNCSTNRHEAKLNYFKFLSSAPVKRVCRTLNEQPVVDHRLNV